MWVHQYLQMSNQIAREKFPGKSLFRTNGPDAHLFGLEPNYGCCTANFNQGWPKFALSAFMHQGDTVISTVPVPSELKTEKLQIALNTAYPFENRLVYTVEAKEDFTFVIRIPSFAKALTVNGEAAETADLTIPIKAGEKREIVVAFESEPYFEERPNDLHTVKCGSLVFSLPIRYEKKMHEYEERGVPRKFPYCDYEYLPLSDWNYGYSSDALAVEKREVSDIPFSSEEPAVVIKAQVQKINWGLADGYEKVCAKIPESREPISAVEEILLYPYGCAKLRMTELPIIE
jgi:hypothetical protein